MEDKSNFGDIRGEDIRISDLGVRRFYEGYDGDVKLGDEYDFDERCDNVEVLELLIDDDIDVNEYLLKLCREYRVRSFYMEGDGKCYERCIVVK